MQQVDLISLGMLLIKTSVFKRIKKPYFSDEISRRFTDSVFCERCRKAGIKVYADFNVFLNHRGITPQTQPGWLHIREQERAVGLGVQIPLTDEQMVRHAEYIRRKTREALDRFEESRVEKLKFY